MPLMKPLCRVCERPTADGAVQAVQLDKEKLQTWLLNVCGYEFAEEMEDEDLICNFCIWHAEFLSRDIREFDALAWWTPSLVYLDDEAKELRRNYLEGKAEQCWVQLEKIELPKIETEENGENEARTECGKSGRKCFYCGQVVAKISRHLREMHENAIRCDYHKCVTYFHTVEEKESHTKEVHEKSKAKKFFKCNFCERGFWRSDSFRVHIRRLHAEHRVNCKFFGCFCYFKSEPEMVVHFDAVHKNEVEAKVYCCHYCDFKSKLKQNLSHHISLRHLPRAMKCDKCRKRFCSRQILAEHVRLNHKSRVCSICNADAIVRYMSRHLKILKCKRCKNEIECSGLYQSHLKTCKQTLFKCQKCPKTFQYPSELKYHLKMKHRNNSWRGLQYKKLGLKCEPCKRYYKSEKQLRVHLNLFHKRLNLKHCAHCPKSFTEFARLKNHLASKHNLIEPKFECVECQKKFVSTCFLNIHKRNAHLQKKNLKSCKVCGKSMLERCLKPHFLTNHGMSTS